MNVNHNAGVCVCVRALGNAVHVVRGIGLSTRAFVFVLFVTWQSSTRLGRPTRTVNCPSCAIRCNNIGSAIARAPFVACFRILSARI